MTRLARGVSLPELLLGICVAGLLVSLALSVLSNLQHTARERALLDDATQTSRQLAHHIATVVRNAVVGLPIYAPLQDGQPSEAIVPLLAGSTRTDLRVRGAAPLSQTRLASAPYVLQPSISQAVRVMYGGALSARVGAQPPPGQHVFIQGRQSRGWGWVRAGLESVDAPGGTIMIRPTEFGLAVRTSGPDGVRGTPDDSILLDSGGSISLDLGYWFYLSNGSVWRKTSEDFNDPSAPTWGPASELGRNVQKLEFAYSDASGRTFMPASLADRDAVRTIEIIVESVVPEPVRGGSQPSRLYTLSVQLPRADEP